MLFTCAWIFNFSIIIPFLLEELPLPFLVVLVCWRCFSFSIFKVVLSLPPFLKDISTGHRIWSWLIYCFSFKVFWPVRFLFSFHFCFLFMATMFSDENSIGIWMIILLYVKHHFLLSAFKIFLFIWGFHFVVCLRHSFLRIAFMELNKTAIHFIPWFLVGANILML